MEPKHLGEIKIGGASIDVYWLYSNEPEESRIQILGREALSVGVASSEKDIASEIVKKFFEGKEGLAKTLVGKKVLVVFSEKLNSASLVQVGDGKRGLPYKSIEAVIGVE